jgi:TolB protein
MKTISAVIWIFVMVMGISAQEEDFGHWLVFQSNRDGNWEIYRLDLRDGTLLNLTQHDANDREPAWSPDGLQITFASDRAGNYEIYTMNLDGSDVQRVSTNDYNEDRYPQYMPDGNQIAFYSDRNKSHDSWKVNLTTGVIAKYFGEAEWSFTRTQDGTRNLLALPLDGQTDIFVRDDDGLTKLTDDTYEDQDPRWSPDESQIVFASDAEGNYDIYLLDLATNERQRLTDDPAADLYPAWQPIPSDE